MITNASLNDRKAVVRISRIPITTPDVRRGDYTPDVHLSPHHLNAGSQRFGSLVFLCKPFEQIFFRKFLRCHKLP